MLQVNRTNNLKIPKEINLDLDSVNNTEDVLAIKKEFAIANNNKFNEDIVKKIILEEEKEQKIINKIPQNSNDLIVITIVKKLCAYVIAVTENSPKRFRGVFVNRMQNYCLDTLECLLNANFIRLDSNSNKVKREDFQKEAIVKLKLLGYVAMIAESSGCILKKQYKQISIQLAEAISLITSWKKSDDKRFNKNN